MDNRTQFGGSRTPAGRKGMASGSSSAADPVSIQPSLEPQDTKHGKDGNAGSSAPSIASDLKDAAKAMSQSVKEQASTFAAGVGQELSQTAEEQKARGVDAIQSFVRAISTAARELEGQSPRMAQSVRDAASKVESLSNNISNRNVDELMKATTDLARSQPVMFIAGAVAAGFALSRFLKSSAGTRETAARDGNLSSHTPGGPLSSHTSGGNLSSHS